MQPRQRVLLALEMREDNVEEILQRLAALRQNDTDAGAVVLTQRSLCDYEWLLRELGALHVALSWRNLQPLTGLVRRFLRQAATTPENPYDRAWERLPWPATVLETHPGRHEAAKRIPT
jgi:hypothetical protein